MPLDGEELVIEPSYRFAKALGRKPEPEPTDFKLRNRFYSTHRQCDVYVFEERNGRVTRGLLPAVHGLDKQLRTLGCSDAWGLEQEEKAIATLRTLVTERQYRLYMLTGSFLEHSKRSGVMYMLRKLRPTVAIDMDHPSGEAHVMCCLCMHPIAHYADSWAGAMCPTDDVIAHLMLMRADEPMYWRRATQHQAHRPEAGL